MCGGGRGALGEAGDMSYCPCGTLGFTLGERENLWRVLLRGRIRADLEFHLITQVVLSKPDGRKTMVEVGRCIRRVPKLFV